MATKHPEGCSDCFQSKQELYPMRKVTVDVFSNLDRDDARICFLFNEPCEITQLYRDLDQHGKLNFKLIIEMLKKCEIYDGAKSIQDELDKHEVFKREDESGYDAVVEKLDKHGDTVLTCKNFEFRKKLIEIQLKLSEDELYRIKVHFQLTRNQMKDFPYFIDVIKLAERKFVDRDNPYRIVDQIQMCLRETLGKSGSILKKLEGFYDLHCKHERLNKIGIGMGIRTIKILTFLFNLKCSLVHNWVSLVSELKSERIFNFNLLMRFLEFCDEKQKSTEILEYATHFCLIENDFLQIKVIESGLSAGYGDLCQRSFEFRCLLVTFSLSNTFQDIVDIRERFDLPNGRALVCVSLLDVVLTTRELKPKDLFDILYDSLKFCEFDSETVKLEDFYAKNRELVDSCSSTYDTS